MRAEEIRALPDEEVHSRLDETKEEYFNLRFQNATGQLENYKQIGTVRKEIARLETILKERELGITTPPKSEKSKKKWLKTKIEEEPPEDSEDELPEELSESDDEVGEE